MKSFLVLFLLSSFVAHAKNPFVVDCVADQNRLDGRIEVPVVILHGAQFIRETPISFAGSQLSVRFQAGDEFETGKYLQMKLDDVVSTIYSVKDGRFELDKNGIRFQCVVSGVTP